MSMDSPNWCRADALYPNCGVTDVLLFGSCPYTVWTEEQRSGQLTRVYSLPTGALPSMPDVVHFQSTLLQADYANISYARQHHCLDCFLTTLDTTQRKNEKIIRVFPESWRHQRYTRWHSNGPRTDPWGTPWYMTTFGHASAISFPSIYPCPDTQIKQITLYVFFAETVMYV